MTNTNKPLVSVVIPTYNHAQYLGRALQSLLDQTYINWEAIVVDNYSTDNTDKILSRFNDSRIAILKINNNGIIAVSRNTGIRAANGEWVAFLDSDDWWTKDKLEICVQYLHDQNDIIHHDLKIICKQSRIFKPRLIHSWQTKKPVVIDLLTRGNALATSSTIVRKKLLSKINGMDENKNMVASEDYNAWLRIAQHTDKFKYVSKTLGFYQLSKNSASRKNMWISARCAVAEFLHYLTPKQKKILDARFKYREGRFNYLSGNYRKAEKAFYYAILNGTMTIKLKSILMFLNISIAKR